MLSEVEVRRCRRLKSDAVGDPKSALVGFHTFVINHHKSSRAGHLTFLIAFLQCNGKLNILSLHYLLFRVCCTWGGGGGGGDEVHFC